VPAQIIDRASLVEYARSSGVMIEMYGQAKLDDAIVRGTDRIRQAMLNDYTADSFESLTPENAPPEMRDYALPLILGILTKPDANRPASINDEYADAKAWLGFIVGGRTHYDQSEGSVLVKIDPGGEVTSQVPDRKFPKHPLEYTTWDRE